MQLIAACDDTKVLSATQTSALLGGPIQIGTSRAEVIGLLGDPYKQEKWGSTEFLFSRTPWQNARSAEIRAPIALLDDRVAGFGIAHYEKIVAGDKRGWGAAIDSR